MPMERHAGPLPIHPDPYGIVAIVIVSPIGPPDDDEEFDCADRSR